MVGRLVLIGVLLLVGCTLAPPAGSAEAVDLALAHVQVDRDAVDVDVVAGSDGTTQVQLVRDVADQDDSVRAVRHVLAVAEVDDELRVVDVRIEQACQPGRGHEGFSQLPCA